MLPKIDANTAESDVNLMEHLYVHSRMVNIFIRPIVSACINKY